MRVIVQHPETVGSGPQLFQTFTVHRSPVTKIMLSEKHLVSGSDRVPTAKEETPASLRCSRRCKPKEQKSSVACEKAHGKNG